MPTRLETVDPDVAADIAELEDAIIKRRRSIDAQRAAGISDEDPNLLSEEVDYAWLTRQLAVLSARVANSKGKR